MFLRITLVLIFLSTLTNGKHLHPEKYYQNIWCDQNQGKSEVKLLDNTRIDCLTNTHAIEFDFASKWAEAIGQSLHYSNLSGKNAGIVLIIENQNDYRHVQKIKPLCEKYEITLWEMTPPKEEIKTNKFYNFEKIIELVINFVLEIFKKILSTYF